MARRSLSLAARRTWTCGFRGSSAAHDSLGNSSVSTPFAVILGNRRGQNRPNRSNPVLGFFIGLNVQSEVQRAEMFTTDEL